MTSSKIHVRGLEGYTLPNKSDIVFNDNWYNNGHVQYYIAFGGIEKPIVPSTNCQKISQTGSVLFDLNIMTKSVGSSSLTEQVNNLSKTIFGQILIGVFFVLIVYTAVTLLVSIGFKLGAFVPMPPMLSKAYLIKKPTAAWKAART